ncbi:C-type lectin domain family 7 member A [Sorex araneus]|uniref:C-type lectin domain family 7 member A n=1 Tax=Sorex araneus TaxID=42254 RepID=UPI002433A839|nr:C-type lectin domain family 7 member A [Sorex araneus]
MDYRSDNGGLDEDGYTQLDFRSQSTPRTPVSSKKVSDSSGSSGTCTDSLHCRTIAVILGILCFILLVIAAVLGAMGALSHSHSCPHGWIKHGKSCYLFMDTLDSWFLSKRKCSLQGSSLLKIDNADELVFIEEQVDLQKDHSFWIGLSRQGKGYPWLWEDGSGISPDLIDVKPTPTVPNASHNCVWIHQSVFYDRLCSEISFSICEKRLLM